MEAPKPSHLSRQFAEQFADGSVVAAYRFRPPYPEETFDVLHRLIVGPRVVLDAGCGSGDLTIGLARIAERADAVDPSGPMLDAARQRPGGDDPRIRWIQATMEEALLSPPYGLVTAGESLQWMDWPVVMRRFAEALAPGGVLAIVGRDEADNPWWPEVLEQIRAYSTNRAYRPYDLIGELVDRGHFDELGRHVTAAVPVLQTVGDYVESIHSRNGFSRDRMPAAAQAAFDSRARVILTSHADGDVLRFSVRATLVWGRPT